MVEHQLPKLRVAGSSPVFRLCVIYLDATEGLGASCSVPPLIEQGREIRAASAETFRSPKSFSRHSLHSA